MRLAQMGQHSLEIYGVAIRRVVLHIACKCPFRLHPLDLEAHGPTRERVHEFELPIRRSPTNQRRTGLYDA